MKHLSLSLPQSLALSYDGVSADSKAVSEGLNAADLASLEFDIVRIRQAAAKECGLAIESFGDLRASLPESVKRQIKFGSHTGKVGLLCHPQGAAWVESIILKPVAQASVAVAHRNFKPAVEAIRPAAPIKSQQPAPMAKPQAPAVPALKGLARAAAAFTRQLAK